MLSVSVKVDIETLKPTVAAVDDHHVIPNFVEGWSFGSAVGVGLRSSGEWWTVKDVKVADSFWEVRETFLALCE